MRALVAIVLGVLLAAAAASTMTGPASAAGVVEGQQPHCVVRSVAGATNQAGLLVKFADGHTMTYCIEFTEDSITGMELLRRSGLAVLRASSGGIGAAVCNIDGQGCNDPGDCFCKCKSGTCEYWAYFQEKNGAWQYSQIGAGARTIRNGDSDAWVWGSGNTPPGVSPADCAIPTETPPPTSTPRPATPTPSLTPRPTSTPPPTAALGTPVGAPTPAVPLEPSPPSTQPAAIAPTSEVLGAAVAPSVQPQAPPAVDESVTPGPSGSARAVASPRATASPSTGIIRVGDDEGRRNAARASDGGSWSWRGTVSFAAFALLLAGAAGGVFVWRARARHE